MKKQIFEAAGKYIKVNGLKKFRMDDVARELNISKKTIYKYFPSKEDLVQAYLADSLEGIEEETITALKKADTLREKMRLSILIFHKHIIPLSCLEEIHYSYPFFSERVNEIVTFKYNLWNDLLVQGINSGEIRSTVDIKYIQYITNLVLSDLVTTRYLYEHNVFFNDAVNKFIDIVFDGIFTN